MRGVVGWAITPEATPDAIKAAEGDSDERPPYRLFFALVAFYGTDDRRLNIAGVIAFVIAGVLGEIYARRKLDELERRPSKNNS